MEYKCINMKNWFLFDINKQVMENASIGSDYYPKSLSKGIIRIIAVANINVHEIVNEFIHDILSGGYNTWYITDKGRRVSIKDAKARFKEYPHFKSQLEAEQFALSWQ